MGATRWQTIRGVVIPKVLPGMVAGIVLGGSRALGETIAVLMVVGNIIDNIIIARKMRGKAIPWTSIGLAFASGRRRELLRSGLAAIRNLLAMGIVLDLIFQLVLYGAVHPGAALVIGPILICAPYAISRALTTRVRLLLYGA